MDIPTTPFKGLAPFGASDLDALLFFGRERERTLIVANVLASRLTVLYGPSGVGKSSLLNAGVAHRLRQDVGPDGKPEHAVVVFGAWTTDPVAGLRAAIFEELRIDDPGGELLDALRLGTVRRDVDVLLILDGLEEYFLYHGDESGPGTFADTLAMLVTEPGLRVSVLLATRDDALSRLDRFKARIPALFSNYLRLDQLDRAAARTAILGPIERYNRLADDHIEIEPELVEAVLQQTGVGRVDLGTGGTGRIDDARDAARIEAPYLQLVLRRLWEEERAEGSDTLRRATLERLGGAEAIVRAHLERALADFDPRERDLAAAVFRHLVTPSGTKIAHAVRDLAGYADVDPAELSPVVTRLVEERILRPIASGGNGSDGVPHEIFHDVLGDAVLSWRQRHETERDVERARSRHRRALTLMSVALVGLLVMTAIAVFAVYQRSQARDAAHVAHARELAARAVIRLDVDPEQSLAWALQAARLEPGRRTESVLRRALIEARLRRVLHVGSPVTVVGYAPDGKHLLIGKQNGAVELSGVGTGNAGLSQALYAGSGAVKVATFDQAGKRVLIAAGSRAVVLDPVTGLIRATIQHRGTVTDAAWSPDDQRIATASLDRTVRVSSARDGKSLFVLRTGPAFRVAFSPDGRMLAAIAADRLKAKLQARLYNGNRLVRILPHAGIQDLAFSPDGSILATSSHDGTTQLSDAATGRLLHLLDDEGGKPLPTLAFSPNGSLLATGSSDGAVRVWRVPTGDRFYFFPGHKGGVTKVVFDPTSTFLVSTSSDHTARVWQVDGIEKGTPVALLAGHRDGVVTAAFSPSGRVLATGGLDNTARLWDARITQTLRPIVTDTAPVDAAMVAANGDLVYVAGDVVKVRRRGRTVGSFEIGTGAFALSPVGLVASAGRDRMVHILRIPSGRDVMSVPVQAPVAWLAFNADATQLVTTDGKGRIVIWNVATGGALHRFTSTRAPVRVALSPSGDVVAAGSANGVVRLWSADGALLHTLKGHGDRITDLRFNSDGSRLVSASQGSSRNAMMWDVSKGSLLRTLVGQFGTVTAASFSSDDRWILTAGPISVVLWPTDTGLPLFYVRGPKKLLTGAEWVPRSYRVFSSGSDGTVRTYQCEVCVPLDQLTALAATRLAAAR
jgi:WD40 repeat protein